MALSLIKDAFQLQKANRKVKDTNSYVSVLNAAQPSGIFYSLIRLFNSILGGGRNSILEEELKDIEADNIREITNTFINIAMKLPSEYQAVNNNTNRLLHFDEKKGYAIKLIGYKIVGFEVAKGKPSFFKEENEFHYISSECELINLQKEGDYNKFKDSLLRQFKESDEWNEYITLVKNSLNQLILNKQDGQYVVDKFSSEQLKAYKKAKDQPISIGSVDIEVETSEVEKVKEKVAFADSLKELPASDVENAELYFSEVGKGKEKVVFAESLEEVTAPDIENAEPYFSEVGKGKEEVVFKEGLEEVTALDIENAELYLHDHEGLIAELLKLGLGNSLLRQELLDYFESDEENIEQKKYEVLNLLKAFDRLYEVPKKVKELHYDNTRVMWQIFGNLGSKSTQEFLKSVKYKEFALLDSKKEKSGKEVIKLLKSINKLPSYDSLEDGVNKTLYTNETQGFVVVQEGKEIVLYTGKPYTLFNPKLRYRIADLKMGYDRLKEKVNAVVGEYKEEEGKPLKGMLDLLGGGANKRFFKGEEDTNFANDYFVKTKTFAIADKEYGKEAAIQEFVKKQDDEELTKICSFQERVGNTKYAKVGGPGEGNPVTYLKTITDPDERMKRAVDIAILLLNNLNILQKNKLSHGDLHLDNMKVVTEDGNLRLEIFDWGHAQVKVNGYALSKDACYIFDDGDWARKIQTALGEKFMPHKAEKHRPIEKILLTGGFDEGFYEEHIEGFRKRVFKSIIQGTPEGNLEQQLEEGVKLLRIKLESILVEYKHQQKITATRAKIERVCAKLKDVLEEVDDIIDERAQRLIEKFNKYTRSHNRLRGIDLSDDNDVSEDLKKSFNDIKEKISNLNASANLTDKDDSSLQEA